MRRSKMIDEGVITEEAMSFLEILVAAEMNLIITGASANAEEPTAKILKGIHRNKLLLKVLAGEGITKTEYIIDKIVRNDGLYRLITDSLRENKKIFDESEENLTVHICTSSVNEKRLDMSYDKFRVGVGNIFDYIILHKEMDNCMGLKIKGIYETHYKYDGLHITPIYEYNQESRDLEFKNYIRESNMHKLLLKGVRMDQLNDWRTV